MAVLLITGQDLVSFAGEAALPSSTTPAIS